MRTINQLIAQLTASQRKQVLYSVLVQVRPQVQWQVEDSVLFQVEHHVHNALK